MHLHTSWYQEAGHWACTSKWETQKIVPQLHSYKPSKTSPRSIIAADRTLDIQNLPRPCYLEHSILFYKLYMIHMKSISVGPKSCIHSEKRILDFLMVQSLLQNVHCIQFESKIVHVIVYCTQNCGFREREI